MSSQHPICTKTFTLNNGTASNPSDFLQTLTLTRPQNPRRRPRNMARYLPSPPVSTLSNSHPRLNNTNPLPSRLPPHFPPRSPQKRLPPNRHSAILRHRAHNRFRDPRIRNPTLRTNTRHEILGTIPLLPLLGFGKIPKRYGIGVYRYLSHALAECY